MIRLGLDPKTPTIANAGGFLDGESLLEGENKHTIAEEIIMRYMWIKTGGWSRFIKHQDSTGFSK